MLNLMHVVWDLAMEYEYDAKFLHWRLFGELSDLNRRFRPDSYMKKIIAMPTHIEKINQLHRDLTRCNLLPKLVKDDKDDDEAMSIRLNANRLFTSHRYCAALEQYTRSLTNAKSDIQLAMGYANRSASLYKLKLYQECLTDIERALAHHYPEHLKPVLLVRREKAQSRLKPTEQPFDRVPEIPESLKNPLIQCASSSVKIEENGEYGRHVVATKTIEIGEIISVEKAYASVLDLDQFMHCHACLILCYNPIPCKNCTVAWFCGEECRQRAEDSYHQYECPILLSMVKYGLQKRLIVLRAAILSKDDLINAHSFIFDKNEPYRSDRYREIHCLRAPEGPPFNQELFFNALKGTLFFELLKSHTTFFANRQLEDAFKNEIVVLMETVMLNGAKISEYARKLFRFDRSGIAGGLFSFFSLFSHSCSHNVDRSAHGSTQVLRAVNTIKAGEQCFVNYGYHYGTVPRSIRQKNLNEDYSFQCKCRACEEDWELLGNPMSFLQNCSCYRMKKYRGRSQPDQGSGLYSPIELLALENRLSSTLNLDFVKQTIPRLIAELRQYEHTEPSPEALIIKEMLSYCYDSMGNRRRL